MQGEATVPLASLACASQVIVPQSPIPTAVAAAHAQPPTSFPIAFQLTPLSACATGRLWSLVVT